jgi:entericidin B
MKHVQVPSRSCPRTPAAALLALAAMACAAALSACNTTEGAGKDIKSLGKGVEEAAHDAK